MKSVFYSESVIIAAMMVILIIASISASALLLLTQTAAASIDKRGGTTNYDTDMTTITTTTTTSTGTITISTAPDNATQQVAVGGGNITNSINQFLPQTTEIQPGESVTFSASNGSTEVHNVIFDLTTNGTTTLDIGVPFALPTEALGGEVPTDVSEELLPALPNSLAEPIIQNVSDGTQAIIGFNKIVFYPAVVDQNGDVGYLDEEELGRQMEASMQQQGMSIPSNLSTSYTMDNTETVVSSGIILDVSGFAALEEAGGGGRSQEERLQEFPPPAYPILSSFTVTFEQPGTYEYFCAFHPGMFGQVVVVGGGETGQTASASATTTATTPSTRQPLT
jgi:plastocyanin